MATPDEPEPFGLPRNGGVALNGFSGVRIASRPQRIVGVKHARDHDHNSCNVVHLGGGLATIASHCATAHRTAACGERPVIDARARPTVAVDQADGHDPRRVDSLGSNKLHAIEIVCNQRTRALACFGQAPDPLEVAEPTSFPAYYPQFPLGRQDVPVG